MMPPSARAVLILGGMSDIGRATARAYAAVGRPLLLAARKSYRLERDAEDLRIRHNVPVRIHDFDVLATVTHATFLDSLGELPHTVVCAVGLLGEQKAAERDFSLAELIVRTNYLGPASILGEVASRMEARGSGVIIGISSVAGERGLARNYVYGSAKAGFTAFLSGLRHRLGRSGIRVITVKPGFVDTQMTAHLKLPKCLTAQPEEVAQAILRAEVARRDIVYVAPLWSAISKTIKLLPEPVLKKIKL